MEAKPQLALRQKTLLAFLGAGEGQELDPIRIMKGLFLFAMKAPSEWLPSEARYNFVPYDYGPCSFEIYSDLDLLEKQGYVRSTEFPGRSWKNYLLTSEGMGLVKQIAPEIDPDVIRYLQKLRDFVSKLSFRQLLSAVYEMYPEYAAKSVFKFEG